MTMTTRPLTAAEVLTSSLSTEWWTPPKYVDVCRAMLGTKTDPMGIDLDPASCAEANALVKASRYFAPPQDALQMEWFGRVFLNPPYGRTGGKSNQAVWTAKLVQEFLSGRVTEAILLVNGSTSAKWFQPLWANSLCFVDHRIDFSRAEANPPGSTHSNVFVYFGKRTARFAQYFVQFGPVVLPHGVYRRKE